MFLVEGKDRVHLREVRINSYRVVKGSMGVIARYCSYFLYQVELKLTYTLDEDRCFVFVSQGVYVGCGSRASELLQKRAKGLAKIMMKKKGLHVEKEIQIQKSRFDSGN